MHNRGKVITLVGKKRMDAGEIVVSGSISGGVNLKIVGEDMEVDDCAEQKVNGAVEEVLSDEIAVVENGNGSIPVQENMVLQGSGQALEGDSDSKFLVSMAKGSSDLVREEEYTDAEVVGNHTALENAVESATENDERVALSVTELVAKARAPVKSEFLTTAAVRVLVPNGTVTGQGSTNGAWDEKKESRVVPEKKSKRQMKRERLQAKRSTEGICAIVARTGDVKQCPYATDCRFNHDLEGYRLQKPPDLPGKCPSLDSGERCSYGIACRYAGTHKELDGNEKFQERRSNMASNELNSLSKDLQKLLWKNMGSYPKSDAQLQAMGLMNKAFKMRKAEGEDSQVQGLGQGENEDAPKTYVRISSDADDSKGSTGDFAQNLITTGESIANHPLPSCTVEASSHPQKRLKSEADEPIENSPANDFPAGNCDGRAIVHTSTELDEDESKLSAMDVPTGDVRAKTEIGKSALNKDGWPSLYVESKLGAREKKIIDFREKLYLAPLTTVGNLPFRRVCKGLGADITCGEMAMCTNLLQGQASEWALLRRHSCEDLFGVQICGSFPDHVARTAELIEQECTVDFIDINMGCPIDLVVNKGSGSCLLTKPQRLEQLCRVTAAVMENPLTVKMRMGYYEGRNCAHTLIPNLSQWGVSAVTIHGRTRQQRYSKQADWAYLQQCMAAAQGDLQVIGNGDVFSYTDWTEHLNNSGSKLSTCMIARGALIKPWLFREIKERRHWDISSGERLDILRQYVHCGLAHWGSDSKGVETTRHFLLEWLSYMHRYIPVGLLEVVPQRLNWRPPSYFGRNDLETMMASESAADWVRISELLLGPTPSNFVFNPKHKSNAYDKPENG